MHIIINDHYISKDNYDYFFFMFLIFFLDLFGEPNLPFESTLISSQFLIASSLADE